MNELWRASALDLIRLLGGGEVSALEITESVLARIAEVEDRVRAYLTVTPQEARARAKQVDEARRRGETPGPIAGVPVAIKDIICTKGIRSTAGSRILERYVPPYSATVVKRLETAGLPMTGKTNLDEFAMGSSTENSAFFPTHNPWDLERVPGGSSGGSAAAVAAGEAIWALGTDTGGSIRQPAALCGVVGLKPTYGLVSRFGLIAFASSLDQAGPLTRTVGDAAALLQAIAGHDPRDATSLPDPVPDYLGALVGGVEGMRIGVVRELMGPGVQDGVRTRVREALALLEKMGAEVGEVHLPSFDYGIDAYYLIAPAEASSNLARFDGVRYGLRAPGDDVVEMSSATRARGFGTEVKRRIMLGTYALSAGYYDAYYGKAQKVRTMIVEDFARAYESFDLLVSPTSPTTAFRLGERLADPLTMYLSDVCTVPSPLAGAPAISIPCGLAPEDGLPVGLQFMARTLDETTMLRAAAALEAELGFADRPPMWGSR
ncbi:MAG: Asp-tRNA(Asn)/Glu-tRNA(Gln) amidotransferase subunit GatA [Actinomycetota bacterium]